MRALGSGPHDESADQRLGQCGVGEWDVEPSRDGVNLQAETLLECIGSLVAGQVRQVKGEDGEVVLKQVRRVPLHPQALEQFVFLGAVGHEGSLESGKEHRLAESKWSREEQLRGGLHDVHKVPSLCQHIQSHSGGETRKTGC
jgi:hypothetical protein